MKKILLFALLLGIYTQQIVAQDISGWDLSPVAFQDSGFLVLVRINPQTKDIAYQGFYTRGDSLSMISVLSFVHKRDKDGCSFGQPRHTSYGVEVPYVAVPCFVYGRLQDIYARALAKAITMPLERLPE